MPNLPLAQTGLTDVTGGILILMIVALLALLGIILGAVAAIYRKPILVIAALAAATPALANVNSSPHNMRAEASIIISEFSKNSKMLTFARIRKSCGYSVVQPSRPPALQMIRLLVLKLRCTLFQKCSRAFLHVISSAA